MSFIIDDGEDKLVICFIQGPIWGDLQRSFGILYITKINPVERICFF